MYFHQDNKEIVEILLWRDHKVGGRRTNTWAAASFDRDEAARVGRWWALHWPAGLTLRSERLLVKVKVGLIQLKGNWFTLGRCWHKPTDKWRVKVKAKVKVWFLRCTCRQVEIVQRNEKVWAIELRLIPPVRTNFSKILIIFYFSFDQFESNHCHCHRYHSNHCKWDPLGQSWAPSHQRAGGRHPPSAGEGSCLDSGGKVQKVKV